LKKTIKKLVAIVVGLIFAGLNIQSAHADEHAFTACIMVQSVTIDEAKDLETLMQWLVSYAEVVGLDIETLGMSITTTLEVGE